MPATATGRGAQVILDGDAQRAARGVYTDTLPGNSAVMATLVNTGATADGSTADGSTLTGAQPGDVVVTPAGAEDLLPAVGGLAIGTVGTDIYSGYTLSWADDFDGPLSVYSAADNPSGRYLPMKINVHNEPASSSRSRTTYPIYYVDPYHTGNNDANRGVAPASWQDVLTQTAGMLRLKTRRLTIIEQTLVDISQYFCGAFTTSAAAIVAQPPFIMEVRARMNPTNTMPLAKVHISPLWMLMMGPASDGTQLEIDWDCDDDNLSFRESYYVWADSGAKYGVSGTSSGGNGTGALTPGLQDGAWHVLGIKVTPTTLYWYCDGQLTFTLARDLSTYAGRPFYWLASSQIATTATGLWGIANNFTRMEIDWLRFWRTSTARHRQAQPSVLPDVNIDFGAKFAINVPSAATVWGGGVTVETVEALPISARAPGGNRQGGFWGKVLPPSITYSGGVLSGTITDQPGRIQFVRTGTAPGDTCEPQRFGVNVGPRILTPAAVNVTISSAMNTYDMYYDADCGNLGPPQIAVANLPAGLTFVQKGRTAGYITGTPSAGSTATVTVTNRIGQTATKSVVFGAATPGAGTACPLLPDYATLAASGLIASLDFDLDSSMTFAAGAAGSGGTISNIAGADATAYAAVMAGAGKPTSVTRGNRHGARFTAASSQYLDWATFQAAQGAFYEDQFTFLAVARMVTVQATTVAVVSAGLGAQAKTAYRAEIALGSNQIPCFRMGQASTTDYNYLNASAASELVDTRTHFYAARLGKLDTTNTGQIIFNMDRRYNVASLGGTPGIVTGTPTPADYCLVGARKAVANTVSDFYDGEIFRVLIFNRFLEDHEINVFAAWAAAVWGAAG